MSNDLHKNTEMAFWDLLMFGNPIRFICLFISGHEDNCNVGIKHFRISG